jgi:hypothetical protein
MVVIDKYKNRSKELGFDGWVPYGGTIPPKFKF